VRPGGTFFLPSFLPITFLPITFLPITFLPITFLPITFLPITFLFLLPSFSYHLSFPITFLFLSPFFSYHLSFPITSLPSILPSFLSTFLPFTVLLASLPSFLPFPFLRLPSFLPSLPHLSFLHLFPFKVGAPPGYIRTRGYYYGGLYFLRRPGASPGLLPSYEAAEITPAAAAGPSPPLVAVRAYASSPFPGDLPGAVFLAGYDCNQVTAPTNTAWVYRGTLRN
jgi:hypothetical protein